MGTHTGHPLLRPFKRLLRAKKKRLDHEEAERALSELRHFLRDRVGVDMLPFQSDRALAPPKDVVRRVQGSSKSHAETFVGGGAQTALRYLQLMDAAAVPLTELGALLDFGIGTGRVARHFVPVGREHHGCDVNDVAVEWCRQAYAGQIEVTKTDPEPPLPYDAARFDLILATSVFTHTPHRRYAAWIEELDRVLRPGGVLAATVHDFGTAEARAAQAGYEERGSDRGLHINTFLTRSRFDELFGARFDVLEVSQDPPNQTFFVAVKPA